MSSNEFCHDIVVIGASLGGIEAVSTLLEGLPETLPAAIFVTIHIHVHSPTVLDKFLAAKTKLAVKFATENETIAQGTVYLAPPDRHLILQNGKISLSRGPRENRSRPAIDPMFRSAAVAYNSRVIGVVLTGLMDDGTAGMAAIKLCGGLAVVQDPKDALEGDMPASVLSQVNVDHTAPMATMAELLRRLVEIPAANARVPDYLRKEVELSQGRGSSMMEQDVIGAPTPFTCPDCGGSITEIQEGDLVRFRCHEGHAYGPRSFVSARSEELEYSLWSAVRMLEEQSSMLRRLGNRGKRLPVEDNRYNDRAGEMQRYADCIKEFLLNMKIEA